MKNTILAPVLSAFVLPGLGQIVNRQTIKGIALMGATAVLFTGVMVKLLLDLSAVMGQVIGPDLGLRGDKLPLIIAGMRARDLTSLYVMLIMGFAIWVYSVGDAYHYGRKKDKSSGDG